MSLPSAQDGVPAAGVCARRSPAGWRKRRAGPSSGQCRRAIGPGASQAIAGVAGVHAVIVVCAVAVV